MVRFPKLSEEKSEVALRDAYGEAVAALGDSDPNVVVLDADLAAATQTKVFAKKFPNRFFNMGIAEQNMVGTAAGLAYSGKTPFASSFAVFATGRAWEQIRNTVCYPKLNVKIVATHAGLTVGPDGGSHQALEDIAIMRAIPNMRVIVPADACETRQAVLFVAREKGPFYVRLGRSKAPVLYCPGHEFKLGEFDVLCEGADASVFACGVMVDKALQAAKLLAAKNILVSVYNASSIKPVDRDAIISAAKNTGAIVTCEEHNVIGGLGSAVAEVLSENYPVPLGRVGVQDSFGESGEPDELLAKYGLTSDAIAKKVEETIKRKK